MRNERVRVVINLMRMNFGEEEEDNEDLIRIWV